MSSRVIPTIQYEDAPRALGWLEKAFGFQRHLVVEGEGGRIDHAQMTFGSGMIMVSSTSPDQDKVFPSIYVIIDDVDGHAAEATTAGADIHSSPEDQHYGGRCYSCRDFEGNLWHFGSYDPWVDPS